MVKIIKKKTKSGAKKTVAKKVEKKVTASKSKSSKAASKKTITKKASVKKTSTPKKVTAAKKVTTVKKSKVTPKPQETVKKTTVTKTGRKVETIFKKKLMKPKKIKGYGKKDLKEFKKIINDKREEIVKQLQNLKDQMMDSSTGQYVNENSPYSLHMAEQGTDAQEREKLYLWAQRETKFLGYLEDAILRIENGNYGMCIDSLTLREGAHLIPKERLRAVPHTQHCVACKNKKQKGKF
ncbi:MAG: TraR/DksA C4-type zinc finger protein [Melioribacteraceae bacterium]